MRPPLTGLGAIVLCGGRSHRMGRPKAWLPFGPERLLQRVVRLAGDAVGPVVVVAAPGQDLPDLPGRVVVVRDEAEGRGPLQGLAAGLEAIGGAATLAYATAVDVPFLAPGWLGRLAQLIGDADLAVPRAGGHLQPLAALYRCDAVRPIVRGLLIERDVGPTAIVARARARVIEADELRDVDPDLGTLINLNTPEEYRDALRRAGFTATSGS